MTTASSREIRHKIKAPTNLHYPNLAMAPAPHKLKITEQCQIPPFPPPASLHPSLPLTFFDLVFLRFPPVQRLFFYDYPYPKSQFFDCELPNLKRSLALALHHFYPLAGILQLTNQKPQILCSVDDSVHFSVAVSNASFYELSENHIARDVSKFHPLVPLLVSLEDRTAVLAVQVTVFPNAGIAIGTTVHHGVADGSTYTSFMKTWASICCFGASSATIHLPSYDRSAISDPRGLESIFLKDLQLLDVDESLEAWDLYGRPDTVRATFVFGRDQLDKLGGKTSMKCSPYSLACGHIWACLIKARGDSSKKTEHFGFVTGCRPRHDPPLPAAYFGNCLGICCVKAKREDLIQENGTAVAAEGIWRVIKGLEEDGGAFKAAENWIKNVADYASKRALTVAGSPKLGIYEVDFGWGRPRKVELISIERTGALSLAETRDEKGGIEVGLVLPKYEMEKFVPIFVEGLMGA